MFKAAWLWSVLPKIKKDNAQGEYYLTDVIELALAEHRLIQEVQLESPEEAIGINTPEQLQLVEKILTARVDEQARFHTRQLPL